VGESEELKNENQPGSIEDELLEVFEDLDKEEKTQQKTEKQATEPSSAVEEKSPEKEGEYLTEKQDDLSDEDSVINEIEAATTDEYETSSDESDFRQDNSGEEVEDKEKYRKKDLFSYLSRKETKKILSHIFLKDEEDFTNTVEKIMECGSYKEASDILKSVFNSYKVSPYAKDAVNFTNAVSNYFRQA
jgi:hypothetical protein